MKCRDAHLLLLCGQVEEADEEVPVVQDDTSKASAAQEVAAQVEKEPEPIREMSATEAKEVQLCKRALSHDAMCLTRAVRGDGHAHFPGLHCRFVACHGACAGTGPKCSSGNFVQLNLVI